MWRHLCEVPIAVCLRNYIIVRNAANSNGTACEHKCTIPCHPGPCPKCPVMVQQPCFCGRIARQVRCSTDVAPVSCESACGKVLSCGLHRCALACHPGQCEPCALAETQRCFCGRHTRDAKCGDGQLDATIGMAAVLLFLVFIGILKVRAGISSVKSSAVASSSAAVTHASTSAILGHARRVRHRQVPFRQVNLIIDDS